MRLRQRWIVSTAAVLFCLPGLPIAADKKVAGTPTAAPAAAPIPQQQFQPRPIPMGVSIGNTPSLPFIYAGTAGLLVQSIANPTQKFILSNNHVLGAKGPGLCPNSAVPGQTWTLQPGTLDIGLDPGNNPAFLAGLVAGFWPLSPGLNLVDAALAITHPTLAKSEILGIGVPNAALGIASPGMPVTKGGRTTGVTTGIVDSINTTVLVNYGAGCPSYLFIGQTMISAGNFSGPGDSGAAILETATKTPVGLLFAGSTTLTIANQIFWVYVLFGVLPDSPSPISAVSVEQWTSMRNSLEAKLDSRIAPLTQVQARHENQILAIPGIHAVGIGLDGGEMVLKAYGTRLTDTITRALPQQVEGVRIVFRESGSQFNAR